MRNKDKWLSFELTNPVINTIKLDGQLDLDRRYPEYAPGTYVIWQRFQFIVNSDHKLTW